MGTHLHCDRAENDDLALGVISGQRCLLVDVDGWAARVFDDRAHLHQAIQELNLALIALVHRREGR